MVGPDSRAISDRQLVSGDADSGLKILPTTNSFRSTTEISSK